jgi:hypothetical protein
MKRISVILMLLAITTTISAALFMNSSNDIIAEIGTAIKSGTASNVSKYFNSTLDLTTPDNEGTYSKTQAELILKDFFTKNPPSSFTINHQGSSTDGSLYAIGTFATSSSSFRTYFLLKKVDTGFLIQKLEFEEQ